MKIVLAWSDVKSEGSFIVFFFWSFVVLYSVLAVANGFEYVGIQRPC